MKISFSGNLHRRSQLDRALETSPSDDTERVRLAYLKWGESCVEHLHGDFSFLVSTDDGAHFGARDRVGIQPFFYRWDGTRLRYATRQSLLRGSGEIDEEALAFALANEWTIEPTLETGVRRLLPGHSLSCRNGRLETSRYFTFSPGPAIRYSDPDQYAEHFLELFGEATRDALSEREAVGLLLSGGLDSTSLAAMIQRARPNAMESFSARFACELCDDPEGLALAFSLGSWPRHLFYPERDRSVLEPHPEESGIFHYPTLSCFRPLFACAAARGIRVMLSGTGGDDVFTPPENVWVDRVPPPWVALYRRFFPRELPRLIHPDLEHRHGVMERSAKHYRRERLHAVESWCASLHRRLFVWGGYAFAFEQEQGFAERFGIQRRYPLFDLRLIDYAFRIPRKQLVSGGWRKRVLRQAMRGLVPARTITRNDPTDFTPLNRRALRRIENRPLAPLLVARGLVNGHGMDKLWSERESCLSHEPLFRLMALEKIAQGEGHNEERRERSKKTEEALSAARA